MGPFAGWSMPLFYKDLTPLESHIHTRQKCSIFDVSHMLQFQIVGGSRAAFLDSLVVSDVSAIRLNTGKLTLFLNENGGIEDDLIVTSHADSLYVVSNAGCADKDWDHVQKHLAAFVQAGNGHVEAYKVLANSLIAVQGPETARILQKYTNLDLSKMAFMDGVYTETNGVPIHITRSGYTGEDGFEISIPSEEVVSFTESLLENKDVKLAGLAPRDSLRIEAGLCLYGHDIDSTTTPMEAGLSWTDWDHVQKHLAAFVQAGNGHVEAYKVLANSLIAVQGPETARILQKYTNLDLSKMAFMDGVYTETNGVPIHITRSGYTGEDGFEISIPSEEVVSFTESLLENKDVKLAGLAPRDSLRIEAGLCLYGHDIDSTTTPMEAGLSWTVSKDKVLNREAPFVGSDVVKQQLETKGGSRRRVGLVVQGAPAREGAKIFSADGTVEIGIVTSGVPSPSLHKNVAMGYVKKGMNKSGSKVKVSVRNRMQDAEIVKMPFYETKYYKLP
ncbi:Aminomethyltransferase, mitochondrial [Smittium mucronatum]|uniref:aminomethyltransferase n=1 Tax=Smittium mucronatum TaxID=133383 RepID=A0A1R0H1K6_9FUNG|nr:Aminomethyltransferase, mitochondrial [Smittium mucronatum]